MNELARGAARYAADASEQATSNGRAAGGTGVDDDDGVDDLGDDIDDDRDDAVEVGAGSGGTRPPGRVSGAIELVPLPHVERRFRRAELVATAIPGDGDVRAADADGRDDPLITFAPLLRWGRFALGAVRRHWIRALVSAVLAGVLGGLVLLASPSTYFTEVTMLVQPTSVLETTVSPTTDQAAPLQSGAVYAAVTSRDALDSYIDTAGLLTRDPDLPPFGKLKKTLTESVFGTPSVADRRKDLRDALETAIGVYASTDSQTVNFSVAWPDPDQAHSIATAVQQEFLDWQRSLTVEPLEKAVKILDDRAAALATQVATLRKALNLPDGAAVPEGTALALAVNGYSDALTLAQNGQLKLAAQEQAFDARYRILEPAEVPTSPIDSRLIKYGMVAVLMVVIPALVCTLRDRRRGRIFADWQLEKVGVPVIATLHGFPYTARSTAKG